jgi:hypothetical protein
MQHLAVLVLVLPVLLVRELWVVPPVLPSVLVRIWIVPLVVARMVLWE